MSRADSTVVPWYYRPGWVLVLLFVVLGPIGLPYLWKSPRFSRRMKIVLTVLVVAYTVMLVDETVRVFRALASKVAELEGGDY